MSSLAKKEILIPRKNLQRTLNYRPHIKWSYYTLLIGAGVFLAHSMLTLSSQILNSSLVGAVGLVIGSSFLPLILLLEARFLIKPLAFTTIHIFGDRLKIDRMGKIIEIPYEEIKQIKFSHIPYTGGWFKLITVHGNYRFTVVLERSEYILEAIMSYNSNLVSAELLESYRKTAIVSDHTWAHLYDKFRNRKNWLFKFILTPFIAALTITTVSGFKNHTFGFKKLLLLTVGMFVFQFVVSFLAWWIASIILTVKTKLALNKRPNYLLRDLEFERRMEFISQNVQKFLIAVLIGVICISTMLR